MSTHGDGRQGGAPGLTGNEEWLGYRELVGGVGGLPTALSERGSLQQIASTPCVEAQYVREQNCRTKVCWVCMSTFCARGYPKPHARSHTSGPQSQRQRQSAPSAPQPHSHTTCPRTHIVELDRNMVRSCNAQVVGCQLRGSCMTRVVPTPPRSARRDQTKCTSCPLIQWFRYQVSVNRVS